MEEVEGITHRPLRGMMLCGRRQGACGRCESARMLLVSDRYASKPGPRDLLAQGVAS